MKEIERIIKEQIELNENAKAPLESGIAKAIEQYVKENYTKNTDKKYSDCCNYEIYEKPNSWKEYCSSCNESCGTAELKKGKNEK